MARRRWPVKHVIEADYRQFTISRDGEILLFIAEASDVCPYEFPGALRVTGKRGTVQFDLFAVERDGEGEFMAWHYRAQVNGQHMELRILND